MINRSATFAAGLLGGALVDREARSAPMRFARMSGSSIAAPDYASEIGRFTPLRDFWGQGGRERQSMLHQLALRVG